MDLSLEERLHLVEDLWDSVAADEDVLPVLPAPLTDEQRTELDGRLDVYERDGNRGRPAYVVPADIRKLL